MLCAPSLRGAQFTDSSTDSPLHHVQTAAVEDWFK